MGFEDGSSIDGWMDRLGTLKDGMRTFFILSAAGDPFPLCFSASLKSSNTAKCISAPNNSSLPFWR